MGDEQAFPRVIQHFNGHLENVGGLTKREYIAAQIMPSVISMALHDRVSSHDNAPLTELLIAQQAVALADALLSALTKEDSRG